MKGHLIHDCAFVGTTRVLQLFLDLLQEDCVCDAHTEVHRILVATLEAFEVQMARDPSRLQPSNN